MTIQRLRLLPSGGRENWAERRIPPCRGVGEIREVAWGGECESGGSSVRGVVMVRELEKDEAVAGDGWSWRCES